jgi:hypothetical protein
VRGQISQEKLQKTYKIYVTQRKKQKQRDREKGIKRIYLRKGRRNEQQKLITKIGASEEL